MMIEFYNKDCMQGMSEYPDKYFELAIIDPPYGAKDAIYKKDCIKESAQAAKRKQYHKFENKAPGKEFFDELFRVSKNQIIWGANFFNDTRLRGGISVGIKKVLLLAAPSSPIALKFNR